MMRLIFFLSFSLFALDYDCVLIGTSPFSLFEALYQSHSGKKVLILEQEARCGGAWKGIDICGVLFADLGCHQIGHDLNLKSFLEEYAGCNIVSLDHPTKPFTLDLHSKNGWYFSKGCYELISNLLKLIQNTDIVLLTEQKLEKATLDPLHQTIFLETKDHQFTTHQLIVTPASSFSLNHAPLPSQSKYFHLYLLIEDPKEAPFTYCTNLNFGISRLMNLTHFTGLTGTGKQLIVIQTYQQIQREESEMFLERLKEERLIDPKARLLASDLYTYEKGNFSSSLIKELRAEEMIEVLQTNHLQNLSHYILKWKQVLKPFKEIFPHEKEN